MGFFRRKNSERKERPVEPTASQQPTASQEAELAATAPEPTTTAEPAAGKTPTELADHLDLLADEAQRSDDADLAIEYYEQSLATLERFGPAYNGLLGLYNAKLSESAHAKDNAAIERWTAKLDQLMDLSKRIMRSNY